MDGATRFFRRRSTPCIDQVVGAKHRRPVKGYALMVKAPLLHQASVPECEAPETPQRATVISSIPSRVFGMRCSTKQPSARLPLAPEPL